MGPGGNTYKVILSIKRSLVTIPVYRGPCQAQKWRGPKTSTANPRVPSPFLQIKRYCAAQGARSPAQVQHVSTNTKTLIEQHAIFNNRPLINIPA